MGRSTAAVHSWCRPQHLSAMDHPVGIRRPRTTDHSNYDAVLDRRARTGVLRDAAAFWGRKMTKPFDIQTDVTLECPSCRAYKTISRPTNLPADVRLIEIICPDCDDGDFHAETWYSASGVEVPQDDWSP